MITEAAGGVRDLPNIVLGVLEKFASILSPDRRQPSAQSKA
jgi:hypothetical protein